MVGRYLLDTNTISEIVRRPSSSAARRYEACAAHCFTSILVAGEIHFGIAKAPDSHASERARLFLQGLSVQGFKAPGDELYGRLRAELERQGRPIGGNDMWIAAHALALECTLVTANEREFRRVPGLRVENWLKPAGI